MGTCHTAGVTNRRQEPGLTLTPAKENGDGREDGRRRVY